MKRGWNRFVRFARKYPSRVRAFALAVLVLVSSFLPGLPVDLIDAVVVASLALAGGETAHRAAKRRSPAL